VLTPSFRFLSGGRFAAAVWADAPKVPIISLASRIINEELRMPPPPAGIPNPSWHKKAWKSSCQSRI